jgi:hypothetical protein
MIRDFIFKNFNSREIVLIIFLLIIILWTLTQKQIRNSLVAVLKALANGYILFSIFALILYVVIIAYELQKLEFWDFSMFKDTLYWTFGVGFILMMNSNKAIEERNYFKKLLQDNLKLTLILEFILGLYVFGLFTEFILMPFVIFFSIMLAYTETYEQYSQVKNFLQILFGIAGIGYLIFSGYRIFKDINEFASFETLKTFLLPIILTGLFIPFAYVYALYMLYDSIFSRLNFSLKDNIELRKYARKRILISANFSLTRLKIISPGFLFAQCKDKSDIRQEINNKLNGKINTPSG